MADLYRLSQYFLTTLSVAGGIDASQTTGIVLQAVTGIDEPTKPGIALLNYSDPLETSACEWITYTSVNTTTKELQGVARGQEDYSAKAHANGATVAFPLSKSHINNIVDKLEGLDTGVTLDTPTITSPTLTSPTVTSPTINGAITLDTAALASLPSQDSIYRQAIMNGDFQVSQRATTFVSGANNNDVYTLDRWNLISDGNDVFDVSQEATEVPDGAVYSIKLDVETAKRGGIVQFLENKDAKKFKGKSVSVSFSVKSANISALRCAVLSWGSTADAITSDVVGTWAATPTWAANWTAENTPADLTVTSDWTTVKVENIAVDSATVNNLALVIWTPNEETIGDIVYITNVQMNEGAVALPFQPKSFEEELRACQRYYEKSFPYETAPADNTGVNSSCQAVTQATTSYPDVGFVSFKTQMRTSSPTITLYNPSASHADKIRNTTDNANVAARTLQLGDFGFSVGVNGVSIGAAKRLAVHWTAEAEL